MVRKRPNPDLLRQILAGLLMARVRWLEKWWENVPMPARSARQVLVARAMARGLGVNFLMNFIL